MSARASRLAGGRDPVVAAAFAAFAVGAVAVDGLGALPVAVGLGTGLVWYVLGTPYAVAVAHLGLVGLFPTGIDPDAFAVLEAPLAFAVLAPARRRVLASRYLLVALAGAATAAGAAWVALESGSLPLAAATLVTATALAAYGGHRYELVRLGLVTEADRSPAGRPSATADTDTDTNDSTQP